MKIHPKIREALKVEDSITDEALLESINHKTMMRTKPCWNLDYCPYGPPRGDVSASARDKRFSRRTQ